MDKGLMVVYKEADEIRKLPIRETFDIQEELHVIPLDLRQDLDVSLAVPKRESLDL
jgi:hypothetical protein